MTLMTLPTWHPPPGKTMGQRPPRSPGDVDRTQRSEIVPYQNRVDPFGAIIAHPAYGTLLGNRGCLHDNQERLLRQYQGRRWIICVLDFKGRKRRPMPPGRYTSLFFLDEATALAAGHRPCAECQRQRFTAFRAH